MPKKTNELIDLIHVPEFQIFIQLLVEFRMTSLFHFCSILYQFRRCSSDFQTKTKSIDERDFWRDSLFYWSKKRESLQKSLIDTLFSERLLKRLPFFASIKKGSLFESLSSMLFLVSQNFNELGNAIPAMLLNFIQYT